MIYKRIVLLANSRKHAERCLAGIELNQNPKKWIRPVSSRPGEGLNEAERHYKNNIEPATLDIVDVPLIQPNPHGCQRENWLVSPRDYWIKQGSMSYNDVLPLAQPPLILWKNGNSTYNGINDEVPTEEAQKSTYSICLLESPHVTIHVFNNYVGQKKVHAEFIHAGVRYRLSVTDSIYEPHFKSKPLGSYNMGTCILTISIGEPFNKNDGKSYQYKLVAGIIPKNNTP